jgi:hypothetical protein
MKTHNIDSVFKKAIEKSGDFYSSEAIASKERIWENVRTKKQKQPRLILFWSLVAACIILFFSTTIITISNIKAKDKIETLAELNSNLKNEALANNQNSITNKEPENTAMINSPDTIYIEKEVIVSKPIVITKVIVDTVFVDQIVYIEKETPQELLAINDSINQTGTTSQVIADSFDTKILIRNSETGKREKKKKFRIKFGGNKDQGNNGTLAISKEF